MHEFARAEAGPAHRLLEHRGLGLARADVARLDREVEQGPDVEPAHVGVAVGEGADHVAPAEGPQHLHRVLVVFDGVPGGEEHLEPGAGEALRLRRLAAGPFERGLQHLHPEFAHVVLEARGLRDDRRPDPEQGVAVVAPRHVRAVRVEPGAKVPLRALDGGLDVPQRVVEVEGDRADRSRMDAVGGHVRAIIIAARSRGGGGPSAAAALRTPIRLRFGRRGARASSPPRAPIPRRGLPVRRSARPAGARNPRR